MKDIKDKIVETLSLLEAQCARLDADLKEVDPGSAPAGGVLRHIEMGFGCGMLDHKTADKWLTAQIESATARRKALDKLDEKDKAALFPKW